MIWPRDITSTRSHKPASSSGSLDLTSSAAARVGPRTQRLVDVEAGPDVDALGGLVGEDHGRLPKEGPRHRHLLLVPARQELHGLLQRRRADLESIDQFLHGPCAPGAAGARPATLNRRSVCTVALTRTPSTGINASRLRSPGSSMIPDRTASWVEVSISSLPSQSTRPACGGWRPARQSKSSGWPLPSAPATPTISPRCIVKLTGPKDWPCRPSTTRTSRGVAAVRRGRWERRLEGAADDQLDQRRLAWCRGRRTSPGCGRRAGR